MNILGQKIKALRKKKGMTQEELVKGRITRNQLAMIENGVTNPSMDTLRYIAERLETSVSFLMAEDPYTMEECIGFIKQCSDKMAAHQYDGVIQSIKAFLSKIQDIERFTFKDVIGKLYHLMGAAYFRLKEEEAGYYLEESLKYLDIELSTVYYSKSLNLLSTAAYSKGDFEQSETLLLKADEALKAIRLDNMALKVDILHNLILTCRQLNKYEEAISYANACLKYAKEYEFYHQFGHINMILGKTHIHLKNYSEAVECNLKAVDYFKLRDDEFSTHRAYINIALIYRLMGEFFRSFSYINLSVKYFKEVSSPKKLVNAKAELSKTLFFISEDYPRLTALIEEIIDSPYLLPEDKPELLAILRLIRIKEEAADMALEHLHECEKLFGNADDSEFGIYVYMGLSKLYKKLGDIETAYGYLLKVNDLNRHTYKEIEV